MKLGYITTCFGTPSHTFIRRELREFEKRGIPVGLFGIRQDSEIAVDAKDLVEKTRFLYPIHFLKTTWCNVWFLFVKPGRYFSIAASCFKAPKERLKDKLKLFYHFFISSVHAKTLSDENYTHLHAHFLNVSASVAMYAARLAGIPYSITLHSAGERDLPHVIGIADKLRFAEKLLMISEFNIRYYDELFPCRDKSSVVRCGMNIEDFEVRQQHDNNRNAPLEVLAVGRFVEKKGFHILIEAAKILADRSVRCSITILGSGPMEQDLKASVERMNLQSIVKLPGHASTEEVKQKMHLSDVVVVPSVTSKSGEMEGIPVVLMEAMASGIPVIGSSHSGIPELVNESTGVLVPENNAAALADAIESFHSDEERVREARALIETQFNIEHVVSQRYELFLGN